MAKGSDTNHPYCPMFSIMSFWRVGLGNLKRLFAFPCADNLLVLLFQPFIALFFIAILPFFLAAIHLGHSKNEPRPLHKDEVRELRFFNKKCVENVRVSQGPSILTYLVIFNQEEAFVIGMPTRTLRHEFTHVLQFRNSGSIIAFLSNYFAFSLTLFLLYGFDWSYAYFNNPCENEAYTKELRVNLEMERKYKNNEFLDETDIQGFDWELREIDD